MTGQGYLLDTNSISEIRRVRRNAHFDSFFRTMAPELTFLSVFTMGELRKGVENKRRKHAPETASLEAWVDGVEQEFSGRILPVDLKTARLWGELSADRSRPAVDTLLAATALVHGLTLVTRNVRDLEGLPVKWHNPWAT